MYSIMECNLLFLQLQICVFAHQEIDGYSAAADREHGGTSGTNDEETM